MRLIIFLVLTSLMLQPSFASEQAKKWLIDYFNYDRNQSSMPLYDGYSFPTFSYQHDGTLIMKSNISHSKANKIKNQSLKGKVKAATYLCPADWEDIWKFADPRYVKAKLYDKQTGENIAYGMCSDKYWHVGKTLYKGGYTK